MDWYAWLSQTNLDASLIYEYGLALVRNEVEEEDLPYFNHDFLQSLGISVARHRLEILKLCSGRSGLSRLVLVMNKTRKLFARKLGFRGTSPPPYRSRRNVMWSSGPLDRRFVVSGPLDLKMHERVLYPNWSPMVARQRQRQRPGLVSPSPALSGPMDRLGLSPKLGYYMDDNHDHDDAAAAQSLWSIMFQDMKPT